MKKKKAGKTHAIGCKNCGSMEFDRITQRDDRVRIYLSAIGIRDRVVREGDAEFTYSCAQCATPFVGE